jgi:hypothetical protein
MDYTQEVATRMRTFTTLNWLAMPYDVRPTPITPS